MSTTNQHVVVKRRVSPIDYQGASRIMNLLDAALRLEDIVDQHGRSVHPEADHFLRDHNEAKRILIKAAKDDIDLRTWIRNKEARQLLFRKGRFQEI